MQKLNDIPTRVIAEAVTSNPGRELSSLRMFGLSAHPNSSNLKIIKALAKSFLELEQRVEAAEAKYREVSGWYAKMKIRALAAEAKLTELEKQEPVAYGLTAETLGMPLYIRPLPPAPLLKCSTRTSAPPVTERASSFVVKLPPEADGSNLPFVAMAWNAFRKEVIEAIKAAGGEVAE